MQNLQQIIKKAELFLIKAEKLKEEQNFARRKWYHTMKELGKQNPNDPRYINFLNKIKENKLLEQEIINSDPELKKKHLENLKLRQQRWKERQDPQKLKEKSQHQWSKIKELQQNNPLKFFLIHLGRQIAFKRKDEKKKNDPKILENFEIAANKALLFKDKVNSFIEGGSLFSSAISELIGEGQRVGNDLKNVLPNISKTIFAIVNELNSIFDQIKMI